MDLIGFYLWGLGVTSRVVVWVVAAIIGVFILEALVAKVKGRPTGFRIIPVVIVIGVAAGAILMWPIAWVGIIAIIALIIIGFATDKWDEYRGRKPSYY